MRLEFIEAGEIVTTHGVRGEMKVLPWSDGPEFLCEFDRVRISGKEFAVETCRVQKTCNLLKLKCIDTVDDALLYRGKTVEVYRCDISDDIIFAAELIGVRVYNGDAEIGKIIDVLDYRLCRSNNGENGKDRLETMDRKSFEENVHHRWNYLISQASE